MPTITSGGTSEVQKWQAQAKTVYPQVNQNIVNGATHTSEWYDLDGYNTLALLFKNETGAFSHTGTLEWSNDGVNKIVGIATLATATSQERVGTSPAYARYVRVAINNAHTAPVVVNTSLYLKP